MRITSRRFTVAAFSLFMLAIIFVMSSSTLAADTSNIIGQWEGHIEFSSVQPKLLVNLEPAVNGSLKGDISLPMQDQHNLPLKEICLDGDCVSFSLSTKRAEAVFKGTYDAKFQTISGEFIQAGYSYPFQLKLKSDERSHLEE